MGRGGGGSADARIRQEQGLPKLSVAQTQICKQQLPQAPKELAFVILTVLPARDPNPDHAAASFDTTWGELAASVKKRLRNPNT